MSGTDRSGQSTVLLVVRVAQLHADGWAIASSWHLDEVEEKYHPQPDEPKVMLGVNVGSWIASAKRFASSVDLREPDVEGIVSAWDHVAESYPQSWDDWTAEQKSRWDDNAGAKVADLDIVSLCIEHMIGSQRK